MSFMKKKEKADILLLGLPSPGFEKFAKELVTQINCVTNGKKVKQETEKWTDFFTFTKLSTNAIRITMWPDMANSTNMDSQSYQSKYLDLGVRGAKFKCCIFVIDASNKSIFKKNENSNDNNENGGNASSNDLPPMMPNGGPQLNNKTSKDLFDEILVSKNGRKGDLKTVNGYLTHLMYLRDNKLFHRDCDFLLLCDNAQSSNSVSTQEMEKILELKKLMKDCKYKLLPCSTVFEESDEYFGSILNELQKYLKKQDWNINEKKRRNTTKTPQYSAMSEINDAIDSRLLVTIDEEKKSNASNNDDDDDNNGKAKPGKQGKQEKARQRVRSQTDGEIEELELLKSMKLKYGTASEPTTELANEIANDATTTNGNSKSPLTSTTLAGSGRKNKKFGIFGKLKRAMSKPKVDKENTLIVGIDSKLNDKVLEIFSRLFNVNIIEKEVPMFYQWQYIKSNDSSWSFRKWNIFEKTKDNFVIYQNANFEGMTNDMKREGKKTSLIMIVVDGYDRDNLWKCFKDNGLGEDENANKWTVYKFLRKLVELEKQNNQNWNDNNSSKSKKGSTDTPNNMSPQLSKTQNASVNLECAQENDDDYQSGAIVASKLNGDSMMEDSKYPEAPFIDTSIIDYDDNMLFKCPILFIIDKSGAGVNGKCNNDKNALTKAEVEKILCLNQICKYGYFVEECDLSQQLMTKNNKNEKVSFANFPGLWNVFEWCLNNGFCLTIDSLLEYAESNDIVLKYAMARSPTFDE